MAPGPSLNTLKLLVAALKGLIQHFGKEKTSENKKQSADNNFRGEP